MKEKKRRKPIKEGVEIAEERELSGREPKEEKKQQEG